MKLKGKRILVSIVFLATTVFWVDASSDIWNIVWWLSIVQMVEVWDNNVEKAIRIFKKKVKESNIMLDLRKKSYYEKPSKLRREKRNLAKLRNKYKVEKEQNNY